MSNLLIIKAHPLDSERSYVLRALDHVKSTYQRLHPDHVIEEVDVFDGSVPELDKSLLDAMSLAKKGEELTVDQAERLRQYNALTDQFMAADKIIIANPLWNLNVPAQLVSWINTINVAGRTFRYTKEGSEGLVKGKKVLHLQSNGGIYSGKDAASIYIRDIFKFLGVEDVHQIFIEGQSADASQAEAIYQNAVARIDNLLADF